MSVEIVEQIIQEVIQLKKNAINRFAKERLTEIENRCYAATMDYRDSRTRDNYFSQLRQVSDVIRRLND